MASKCPKCGAALHWYDFKAECRHCGANIPNYNWEERLEEDSRIAEEKFREFYRSTGRFRYSIIGTKLRIWRLVLSFTPIFGFVLPWAKIASEQDTLNLELFGIFTKGTSLLKFFPILFDDIGGIISKAAAGSPAALPLLGLALVLLGIIAIFIAFFLIFIRFRKSDTKAVVIADLISLVSVVAATVLFILSGSKLGAEPFSIGTLNFTNADGGAMWGIYVFALLLTAALVINILVAKSEIKSDEVLEAERLERVRIKEEKAEAERIKKEAARAEARKKAEEEEAEKIRKAKEALAAKENKKR